MKAAKWCATGIGIILVMAVLTALISNMAFGLQYRETLARLRDEGRPVTIAEFKPAPVPVEQNAAPLLQEAALWLSKKPVSTATRELLEVAHENYAAGLSKLPENKRELAIRSIAAPESEKLLAILREAAQKHYYNARLEYEKAPAFRTPSFLAARQLIEILSLKAEALAHAGNGKEAGQTVLTGFRISRLLKQEPLMLQLLLSVASDRILVNTLYRITDNLDLPTDTLQLLENELEGHSDNMAFVRAINENIIHTLAVYQILLNGTYRDIQTVINDERIPPPVVWLYRMSGLLHRDMSVFLELQAGVQDKCRMPSHRMLASLADNPVEKQIPVFSPMTRIGIQALDPALLNTKARYEAALAVTRVGLALKRYKAAHGAYPPSLENLDDALEGQLKDPCSGNSLLYRKEGDGFMLYSVSSDRQDNMGEESNPNSPTRPFDIVWETTR